MADCELCERLEQLTGAATVLRTDGWICYVNASFSDPGCVIQAVPHVDGLWSMTEAQSASFGPTVGTVVRAVRSALSAERAYLVSMGENHVHLHALVLPRTAADPADSRGASRISRYVASRGVHDVNRAELLAARIRRSLGRSRLPNDVAGEVSHG